MNDLPRAVPVDGAGKSCERRAWIRFAWIPAAALLVAMIGLRLADIQAPPESPALILMLCLLLIALPNLIVAALLARIFLSHGAPGMLLLGCGALAMAASGLSPLAAAIVSGSSFDANTNVTINCLSVWDASLCFLGGAVLLQRWRTALRRRAIPLIVGYASTLAQWIFFVFVAQAGWTPVFLVPDLGASLERQFVLVTTIFALVLAAVLVRPHFRGILFTFSNRLALALLLLAVGSFDLMLQTAAGGAFGWISRAALFLGGGYMFFAAGAASREVVTPQELPEQWKSETTYPYAVAIFIVLVATALRLVFLQQFGTRFAFITFYPALVFVALYGGLRAGVLATLVSTVFANYFWMEPSGSHKISYPVDWVAIAVFIFNGVLLSWIIEALHEAQGRLRETEAARRLELETLVARRTTELTQEVESRKRAEEALREADRRKDEFLATLAHELRNPLAPIRTGLHVLHRSGGRGSAAERVQEMMERQVEHLIRLVDDLMEVSRISRGKIELKKERVDLSSVIAQAVEANLHMIEASGLALHVESPEQPLFVEADSVRLVQVLANLINNAAKYTDSGGRIEIAAERRDDEAVVTVSDTGVGIPAEMLPGVFELFAQVETTHGRARGGLGIGLALVRDLVRLHGGQVEAHSAGEGRGSRFVIRLPLSSAALKAPGVQESAATPVASSLRALIIDDNRDAAESLALLLDTLGLEVRVAYDGATGLEACAEFMPELVLLDLGMPGMDGFETARRIRERAAGRSVVLVALTGWGGEETRDRTTSAGFDRHLIKPADLEEMKEVIEFAGGVGATRIHAAALVAIPARPRRGIEGMG